MRAQVATSIRAAPTLWAAGTALGGLAALVIGLRFGAPVGLGVVIATLAVLLLLSDARAALILYVAVAVFAEGEEWGVPLMHYAVDPLVGFLAPLDLIGAVAVGAVAIDLPRSTGHRPLPATFVGMIALYVIALLSGTITGVFGDSQAFSVISEWRALLPLLLVPLLVTRVLAGGGLGSTASAARAGFAVSVAKAMAGLAVVFTGLAPPAAAGDPPLTYYSATGNWIVLVGLVGLVTTFLAGGRPGVRGLVALVILGGALLLSYRRAFWVAGLVCLVAVLVVAPRRLQRRIVIPAACLAGLAIYVVLAAGLASGLQGPLGERVRSLDPAAIRSDEQDRYRLDERRNVVADLRRAPLLGLGAGSQWTGRFPVGLEEDFSRSYVHLAVLWNWLKMGVVGVAAYLGLLGSGLWAGWTVWRRHSDPVVRRGGLAAAAGFLALGVVELTATFVGTSVRMGVVLGAVLGWLAVAWSETPGAARRVPAPAAARAG